MQDNAIYGRYKPVRNAISKLCLADSLGVIWAYVQDLQFGSPIPRDYEVHPSYASATSKGEKIKWLSEFHLETLCREIILHSQEGSGCSESMKDWKTLSRVVNGLKDLENFISGRFTTPELLQQELHRIVHRQFPWQRSIPNAQNITRYYVIYKHPPLAEIIKETTGLHVDELVLMGMALLGCYVANLAIFYPPSIKIPGLSLDTLDRFLQRFSIHIDQLKARLKAEREMNDKFSYAYNSMRAYPLIRMEIQGKDSFVCPLPTLLFWRFTAGVYYEICGHSSFANAFGEAFQSYVGDVIARGIKGQANIYPEDKYYVGKDLKRTVDWILDQRDAAIFLEAKTKRLALDARVEAASGGPLSSELAKLATMVVQVYKSIRDYRENLYPALKYNGSKQLYPLVVTLEDWFLMGPLIKNELDSHVMTRMRAENIPESWLTEMPYTVCSIDEFETAIQFICAAGIESVLRGKAFDPERQQWTLGAYLRDLNKSRTTATRFLFDAEYERLGVTSISKSDDLLP